MNVDAGWLRERSLGLCWSLWSSLGVPAWEGQHDGWSIELEPLIVFTAQIATEEPRLLREAVAWCVANEQLVSLRQLRHASADRASEPTVRRFMGTVSLRASRRWQAADGAPTYELGEGRAKRLGSLHGPARLQLRLRATFGVGARAEIVRVLLVHAQRTWSAPDIAERVAYTRRQVESDLHALTQGGLVARERASAGWTYRIASPRPAAELFGPFPTVSPRWAELFDVLVQLEDALEQLDERRWRAPDVELAGRLRGISEVLGHLRLAPPTLPAEAPDYEHAIRDWIAGWVEPLSNAQAEHLPAEWLAHPVRS